MWGLLCKWWWAEKKSKLPWEVDGEQLTELVLSPFFQVSGHIELYSLRVERAKLSGLTAVTKHCLGCSRLGSITSWLTHQLMQNTWDSNLWPSKTSNNLWIMNVRVHGGIVHSVFQHLQNIFSTNYKIRASNEYQASILLVL